MAEQEKVRSWVSSQCPLPSLAPVGVQSGLGLAEVPTSVVTLCPSWLGSRKPRDKSRQVPGNLQVSG